MEINKILFYLIRCAFDGVSVEKNNEYTLDDSILKKIYLISKAHDIANIVGVAITRLNIASGEIKDKFVNQQMTAVYRYERTKYELQQIKVFFNENNIEFIPLKGSVLCDYYPEPWMRTSCDIDILIHKEDLEKTKELLMQKKRYELKLIGSHDIGFFSPSGVHIELHYSLIEDDVAIKADLPLNDVWKYSAPSVDCPMMYEMTNEMFYYYHIAHMVKHFLTGGCGIRPFIDLFVINRQFNFDEHAKQELLLQGGLLKFAEQAEELSKVWFEDRPHTELTKNIQDYVMSGGVYGTMQNRVAIQQTQKRGAFRYALSRIWLPCNKLKFQYPVLNKHKWLLPICEVRRWFRLVFGGSFKGSMKEFKVNSSLTSETAYAAKDLLSKLEL